MGFLGKSKGARRIADDLIKALHGRQILHRHDQAQEIHYKVRHRRLQDGKIIERRFVEYGECAECICGCRIFKAISYLSNQRKITELRCVKCNSMPLLKFKAEELKKEMKPDLLEFLGYKKQAAIT